MTDTPAPMPLEGVANGQWAPGFGSIRLGQENKP